MLSLEDARDRILSSLSPLGLETVALRDAVGRYVGSNVGSPINLPGFDNSAMDGYAVCSSDLKIASESDPVLLTNIGEVPAGSTTDQVVEPGRCIRIFTGSPLPVGADAVVMQEDTRPSGDPGVIQVTDSVRPWENIRFAGEDVKKGAAVAGSGEKIHAGLIALLAACGLENLSVGMRPTVGLLATGSELVEPGLPLAPGQIYESNRTLLAQLVERSGGRARAYPIIADNLDVARAAIAKAFDECDVVISSGGVSVGDHDYVKPALENLGGKVEFWKVSVRPGKPFVHGLVNGKHFFGLPGNPISTFVTFLLLVRPALVRMQGGLDLALPTSRGVLGEAMINKGNRRHFARIQIQPDGQVLLAGLQASHALSSLAKANGLLEIPAETTWEAGREVSVLLTNA